MSNPMYEALVKEKKHKIAHLNEAIRNQLLEKHHLYEEIQGPKSEEYPHSRWENNKVIYYKKTYENVTDEELKNLEALVDKEETLSLKADDDTIDETRAVGFVATTVIGFICIFFGTLVGFILALVYGWLGIVWVVLSVIAGIAFLTAAHIIRQLNIIINNLNKDK